MGLTASRVTSIYKFGWYFGACVIFTLRRCISTSFFVTLKKTLVVRPAMLLPPGKKDSLLKKELSIFAIKDFAFAHKTSARLGRQPRRSIPHRSRNILPCREIFRNLGRKTLTETQSITRMTNDKLPKRNFFGGRYLEEQRKISFDALCLRVSVRDLED